MSSCVGLPAVLGMVCLWVRRLSWLPAKRATVCPGLMLVVTVREARAAEGGEGNWYWVMAAEVGKW
jgi:predicted signal transduction protein with EAL and GGDEF domain